MIVRNVIDHKKEMIQQMEGYTCDIYIKGVETFEQKEKKQKPQKEEPEPIDPFEAQEKEITEKIAGNERLNLVEINLTKHFQYPNKIKEIRNGYEKLGNPNQIYFLSTVQGEFNFYESLIQKDDLHQTPIVSPLHPSGILSYKYKLTEINTVEKDTIYTIQISSRTVGTSTLSGFLYIKKNEWVLTKVDLSMHKGNLKTYDDFRIIQEFEKSDSLWLLKEQQFEYSTKYGKETVKGKTHVSYSNYKINPTFPTKFFTNEIGITTEEAYERDSTYWDDIRPVALTIEEQRNKFIQDSLTAIYTSEAYLDSITEVFNRITFLKVAVLGVRQRNLEKKTQWYLSSVIELVNPTAIGGIRFGPSFSYFKKFENEQYIRSYSNLNIGFNNADIRGKALVAHLYNPKRLGYYRVQFSKDARLINWNTAVLSILNRQNIYQNTSLTAFHQIEIFNGFYVSTNLRIEERSPFDLDYRFVTWFDKQIENGDPIQFDPYNAFRTDLTLHYTPGQKYLTEPHRKVVLGSRWPTLSVTWNKGWEGPFKSVIDFDYIEFGIKQDFQIGTIGQSKYTAKIGTFVNQDSVFFIDRKFFRKADRGNIFSYAFVDPLNNFQNLDSSYETNDFYLQAHYIHHFNGAIINKIPFMKKTGIKTLFGGGFIYLPEHNNYFYSEAYIGVERIFKVLRQRVRLGGYFIASVSSNQFGLPTDNQPKNFKFAFSFDIMNEDDFQFNY